MTSTAEVTNYLFNKKALVLAVSAALAPQAQAQQAENADSTELAGALEEVIVTATKRESSMQDIPIAVTAISGDMLAELQIVNVLDIDKTVPGLKVRYVGADPTIIIRGAGTAGTNDIAVPMYIDGLYRPRAGQALASYFDLERVEVLRGPQGTLFGRNTFGGLINLIAKKPEFEEFDYGGAITVGEFDLRKFEGFVNVPLGDTAALRISASDTKADAYIENIYNPKAGMRDEDNTYARAQLKWAPTENFDITFTATFWEDTSNGNADYAGVILGIPVNDEGWTDGINGVMQPRQGRLPGQENLSRAPAGGRNQAGVYGEDPAANLAEGVYNITSDFTPLRDIEETSYSALINWDLGPVGLRANFGWFEYEEFRLTDSDFSSNPSLWAERNPGDTGTANGPGYWQQCWGGPTCGLAAGQRVNSNAVQADINLYSNNDGALQWTLGYFYYDDSGKGDTSSEFVWGYTDYTAPQNVSWGHWLYQGNGGTKSTAMYGQATYSFNDDRTRITAGLRYSTDKRNFFNRYVDWGPAVHGWASGYYSAHYDDPGSRFDPWPSFVDSSTSATEDSRQNGKSTHTDWKLALQHDVGDNGMIYGSAASGYIAGSIEGGGSNDLTDPNEALSYELGYKSTLLDGTMRLNMALFYNDYDGLTTSSFIAQGETIVAVGNVGGSMTSKGLEVEINWQPSDEWSISSGFAYNDSELKEFSRTVLNRVFRDGGDFEIGTDEPHGSGNSQVYILDGQEARFSPDWTLYVDASYVFDMGSAGQLVPGVYIYHSDDYKTTNIPYFFSFQDAYTTLDLRLTWRQANGGNWSVQGFITNATDEVVQIGSDQFSEGRAIADFNKPRTWGVTARYNF
jgi:iron complex outermembrane receptor protein